MQVTLNQTSAEKMTNCPFNLVKWGWEFLAVVPAQAEVGGEDKFPRMVHWPPHQADHQHLQPAALQQVHLVQETELYKPWAEENDCELPDLLCTDSNRQNPDCNLWLPCTLTCPQSTHSMNYHCLIVETGAETISLLITDESFKSSFMTKCRKVAANVLSDWLSHL